MSDGRGKATPNATPGIRETEERSMGKSGIWSKTDAGSMEQETGDAAERRREPRYIPAKRTAYLGWWEGEAFRSSPARVESLSCHGAALLVEHFPAGAGPIWLALIHSGSDEWFAGNAIHSSPSGGVGRVVRVALSESLPYDVFKTFCLGLPNDDDAPQQASVRTTVDASREQA